MTSNLSPASLSYPKGAGATNNNFLFIYLELAPAAVTCLFLS